MPHHLIAALPAGILAAIGLVTLVADRTWKSDVVSRAFCLFALLLAASTLGFQELARSDGLGPQFAVNQTIAGSDAIDASKGAAARRFFIDDRLSRSAAWLALGLGLLAAATAIDGGISRARPRFAILLLTLSGVSLAANANDLPLAVIAMELASLPAVVLFLIERNAPNARAAGVRAFALNLLALGMLVGGAALIRFTSGTTILEDLQTALPQMVVPRHARMVTVASSTAGTIGYLLILAGLGVHFLAAPFQLAAAELFDAAKSWSIGLIALFPRGAALLLMIRVLVYGPLRLQGTMQTLFTSVGFLTILIGSLLAVPQFRIRRLLACTVFFQSGVILATLAAACSERARPAATPWLSAEAPGGVGSACLCFALDSLALVGVLALVASRERSDRPLDDFEQVAEAVRGNRVRTTALCVLVASLAGIPPFAGFWPRIVMLRSILSISVPPEHGFAPHQNVDYVVVAIATAGGLILLASVWLGLIKKVLLDDVDAPRVEVLLVEPGARTSETTTVAVGLLAALAAVVLGIFPGPATRAAAWAASQESVVSDASADRGRLLPDDRKAAARGGQRLEADHL